MRFLRKSVVDRFAQSNSSRLRDGVIIIQNYNRTANQRNLQVCSNKSKISMA